MIDLRLALYTCGILRVIHNATKAVGGLGLLYWDTFIIQLTHVSRLLKRKWSKQRLIATCFRDPPASAFAERVRQFDKSVYVGRWASIILAIAALIPLEDALRSAWSLAAFTMGGRVREEDLGRDGACKLDICDEAINSELFWSYLKMVGTVADQTVASQTASGFE